MGGQKNPEGGGGGSAIDDAMECLLLVKKIDEKKERINLSWLK